MSITISEVNIVLTEQQYRIAIAIIRDNVSVMGQYRKIDSDDADDTSEAQSNTEAAEYNEPVQPANVYTLLLCLHLPFSLN